MRKSSGFLITSDFTDNRLVALGPGSKRGGQNGKWSSPQSSLQTIVQFLRKERQHFDKSFLMRLRPPRSIAIVATPSKFAAIWGIFRLEIALHNRTLARDGGARSIF